jgi:hypothetical protein
MKTKSFHKSNLGVFGATLPSDFHGYVEIHDSPRYESMSTEELEELYESTRLSKVRSACATELMERKITKWQSKNSL